MRSPPDTASSESSHNLAVAQALLVTFLWSTSWILIKIGLQHVPALTFAGLRYVIAALILLPFALRGGVVRTFLGLSGMQRLELLLLGLVMYSITQGAQFLALAYLPAATASLVLSMTPLVVALLATMSLNESLGIRQWIGILLTAMGAWIYFGAGTITEGQTFGLIVIGIGLVANALASLLGRAVNRRLHLSALDVTVVSMTIGSIVLLTVGVHVQGLPALPWQGWLIVGWLALVNTAGAFLLWNHTLRRLTAAESSVINNTMLIQIALLALLILGETLAMHQWLGILIVAVGTALVQRQARWFRRS